MSWIGIWYETTRRLGSAEAKSRSVSLNARGRFLPPVLQQVEVAERADLAVEHLGVDAVGVHVDQPLVRVDVARAAPRRVAGLGVGLVGLGRVPAHHEAARTP